MRNYEGEIWKSLEILVKGKFRVVRVNPEVVEVKFCHGNEGECGN